MCNIQVLELALGNKNSKKNWYQKCIYSIQFEIEFLTKRDWNSAFTIKTVDVHEKGLSDEVLNLDVMEKSLPHWINFILLPI